MTKTLTFSDTILAKISPAGDLIHFDGVECRRLAAEFVAGQHDQHRVIAMLCASLLDRLAKEFDHVLRETKDGGGTMGDMIRQFNIDTHSGEAGP